MDVRFRYGNLFLSNTNGEDRPRRTDDVRAVQGCFRGGFDGARELSRDPADGEPARALDSSSIDADAPVRAAEFLRGAVENQQRARGELVTAAKFLLGVISANVHDLPRLSAAASRCRSYFSGKRFSCSFPVVGISTEFLECPHFTLIFGRLKISKSILQR